MSRTHHKIGNAIPISKYWGFPQHTDKLKSKKWYIHFNGHVVCIKGLGENPLAFDSRKQAQAWINENCDPISFPEVELIETDTPDLVLERAAKWKRDREGGVNHG